MFQTMLNSLIEEEIAKIELETGKKIMEEVNQEVGMNSVANGITFALPTEKAYKI